MFNFFTTSYATQLQLSQKSADSLSTITFIIVQNSPFLYLKSTLNSVHRILNGHPKLSAAEVIVTIVGTLNLATRDGLDSLLLEFGHNGEKPRNWFYISGPKNDNVSSAFNRAVNYASGKYLVFLSDTVELVNSQSVLEMISLLEKDEEIAVVGPKIVLAQDRTIHRTAINFIMVNNPKRNSFFGEFWNRGFKGESEKREVVGIFHRHEGQHLRDKRTLSPSIQYVQSVTKECMVMSKRTFDLVGGFNTSFREYYFDADFCLKAQRLLNKKIVYTPNAILLSNVESDRSDETDFEQSKEDLNVFQQGWGELLAREIENNYLLHNITLVWDMECGTGQVLGFTTEALNFIVGLWDKVRIKVKVNNIEECREELLQMGLPRSTQKLLTILLNRPYRVQNEEVIAVIHRDPGRYEYFVTNLDEPPAIVIGRSMFETDRIPQNWVEPCNEIADVVWVPSKFNIETFSRSGVNITHLDTVPSAIDVYHFDPSLHTPLHLTEFNTSHKFHFLSVMKWEPRKAWDLLITAFLEEFSHPSEKDHVSLVIRSKLDSKNKEEFDNLINGFLEQTKKTRSDLPQIVFLDQLIPYTKLPSLYKAVDCFVLPSHGEGWGLPLMEAMAMELSTIGTNWSGNTEFMNEQNSYLIQVQKMDSAVEEGHQWATPSLTHLRQLLRKCYSNRTEAKMKARVGREEIVEKYSVEKVSQLIIQKLRRLQQNLPTLRREREQRTKLRNLAQNENKEYTSNRGTNPSLFNLYNTYNFYRNRHNRMEPLTNAATTTTTTVLPGGTTISTSSVGRNQNRIKIRIID